MNKESRNSHIKQSSPDWLSRALSRNVNSVITEEELKERLRSKKQLRIKFGVDVTNPHLHIGHGVNLWKLREFQEAGHKVIFLIGDFTSLIGDPTGRAKTRSERTAIEIEKDAEKYLLQAGKILLCDSKVFEVRKNSEWYQKMSLTDFFKLCGRVTHARLIQRDMFQRRIEAKDEIYMHEILYPILQGYDSFMLKSDLTIVGADQLFNELMGRHYQEALGDLPQIVMTTVITPGLTGREKQSKSLGNFVGLNDSADEQLGKLMTLPDELIITYWQVYSKQDISVIAEAEQKLKNGENPRDIKMQMAVDIVSLYHGLQSAQKAQEKFINVFQKKAIPEDAKEVAVTTGITLLEFLRKFHGTKSNSDARRLLFGKAVHDCVNDEILDEHTVLTDKFNNHILKVGKRSYYKLKIR